MNIENPISFDQGLRSSNINTLPKHILIVVPTSNAEEKPYNEQYNSYENLTSICKLGK